MKKITALLGFVGVVSMISGCTSDTGSKPDVSNKDELAQTISSSSVSGGKTSSSSKGSGTTSKPTSSNATAHPDTVTQNVVVRNPDDDYEDPYFSSGIFCWSEECEKTWTSSSSVATSSPSASIEVTMSSEAQVLPVINGDQMIDQRDGKTYKLQTIGPKRWMAENLNFVSKTGYYCKTEGGEDMCATNGGYYSYAAAQRICPTGWRLPTEDEVDAAYSAMGDEWWTIGGRFKYSEEVATEFGNNTSQGYIWISSSEHSSWLIQVGSGAKLEFQTMSAATGRAYNVRCVEGQ